MSDAIQGPFQRAGVVLWVIRPYLGPLNDAGPVKCLSVATKRLLRSLLAEHPGQASLVKVARRQAEVGCRLVLLTQVGVEHRRVVSGEGAADPGCDQLRQRMLRKGAHSAG